MQHPKLQIKRRAVTLTELLVVVVIISLLATIAVPVYVNKAEQARIATAIQETRELANAEEQCGIAHGIYVPLQMLDDNPKDTSFQNSDDIFTDVGRSTIYYIHATLPIRQQQTAQATFSDGSRTSQQIIDGWAGPFVNIHRAAFAEEILRLGATNDSRISFDFPLDPWGTPYRLYSPLGVVGNGSFLTDNYTGSFTSFANGQITFDDPNRFDRFAVVSYGPDRHTNGQAGAVGNARRDDISHLFGGIYTESSFQAFFR